MNEYSILWSWVGILSIIVFWLWFKSFKKQKNDDVGGGLK